MSTYLCYIQIPIKFQTLEPHPYFLTFTTAAAVSSMGSSFPLPSPATILFFIIFFFTLLPSPIFSGPVSTTTITPNFKSSYFDFIDSSGIFLNSRNNSFQAQITSISPESDSFYFVIIHVVSRTIIWSANRNSPISKTSPLNFTSNGLVLYNDSGFPIWSTPRNLTLISSLQLLETGNLVLIDSLNNTVWESFDFPTDVIVLGQRLKAGNFLVSSVSEFDLSEGSYRLMVGSTDAILQWNFMDYWRMSMDTRASTDTSFPVEYMVLNFTGIYLMGRNGQSIVIRVILENSLSFGIVKLNPTGVFSVFDLSRQNNQVYHGPSDSCRIPNICKRLSICTNNGGNCQCPPSFHQDLNGNCVPNNGSLAVPSSCTGPSSSSNGTNIRYLNLRNDLDYFSNGFVDPGLRNVSISVCQSFCSNNCSCMGVFYSQNSRSCYTVTNSLGSVFVKSGNTDRLGYVKTVVGNQNADSGKNSIFPLLAAILFPLSGVSVIAAIVCVMCYRERKKRNWGITSKFKLGGGNSSASVEEDMDFVSIPGLPVRFEYEILAQATEHFRTRIGSGGFGTVYKGTLNDGSDIAVKKITCLGAQGKREFLAEISVIGKIHHINLVRLKGFCTHGGQRLLVYEYMNRGSLDRTLFCHEPVLEWRERYEIALGTARGLAYLHSGCEETIIHCDIKPENILLHEKSQVKLSDFGLSKLLSAEQSGLFTTMRGTRGYLAPEWLTNAAITDRTDVYSYGMVVLEIIRGKKNSSTQSVSNSSGTDSSSSGESTHRPVYFPMLALEMHEAGRYLDLVDPRLMGRVRAEDVEKLVRVALCCVHEEPNLRPSMTNVVGMLEGGMPLWMPRIESLNFLRSYGRRFTEVSTLGTGENHEFERCRQQQVTNTTNNSYDSFSYLSSQEVSGPR